MPHCEPLSHSPMRGANLCAVHSPPCTDHIKPLHTVLWLILPTIILVRILQWNCSELLCLWQFWSNITWSGIFSRNVGEICVTVFLRETERVSTDGSALLCRETPSPSSDIKSRDEHFRYIDTVTRMSVPNIPANLWDTLQLKPQMLLWRWQEMPENHQGW